jgi:hypothetical protein
MAGYDHVALALAIWYNNYIRPLTWRVVDIRFTIVGTFENAIDKT